MTSGTLRRFAPLIALAACALAVRLALTPLYAYLTSGAFADEYLWKLWMEQIHEQGVLNIFRSDEFVNYVGYQWVLWLLAEIYAVIGGPYTDTEPALHVLVKMPSIVFDFALFAAVYAATRALASDDRPADEARPQRLAFAATAVIAFQPAVLYDSAVWAQTDSAITCAMLAAIVLASRGSVAMAWAVLALGFLVKPQPVIVSPVVAVLTLHTSGIRGLARGVVVAAAVVLVGLSPWLMHGDGGRIVDIYRHLFQRDVPLPATRLSEAAWNVWWFVDVAQHPLPRNAMVAALPFLSYERMSYALLCAAGALALAFVVRRPGLRDALIAAAYIAFAFYMLPISTHERYLYPFFGLLLPVVMVERRWLWLYIPASATFFLNLFIVGPPVLSWAGRWSESPFSLAVAAVNVVLFVAFTAWLANATVPLYPRGKALLATLTARVPLRSSSG